MNRALENNALECGWSCVTIDWRYCFIRRRDSQWLNATNFDIFSARYQYALQIETVDQCDKDRNKSCKGSVPKQVKIRKSSQSLKLSPHLQVFGSCHLNVCENNGEQNIFIQWILVDKRRNHRLLLKEKVKAESSVLVSRIINPSNNMSWCHHEIDSVRKNFQSRATIYFLIFYTYSFLKSVDLIVTRVNDFMTKRMKIVQLCNKIVSLAFQKVS